jgi:hypothetical protein
MPQSARNCTIRGKRFGKVTVMARMNRKQFLGGLAALTAAPGTALADQLEDDAKYTANEITQAGADFFGVTTEAMAKAVQHIFGDLGQPDAYIKGDEGSGAFVVGLRYGSGWLVRKNVEPVMVYWRGPSIGFDVGADASKCFTLCYNLRGQEKRLLQRFPGVEGSFYFIAGLGVNYQRSGGVTLAPIRNGVGVRAGVNAHYQVYSNKRDWFPL